MIDLYKIKSPDDIKDMSIDELNSLAHEIRNFLINSISKTGGHLSSNLGVVELTIALHYVFNSPKDKFIFDVGHQSYVHKILTGRIDRFDTLRKYEGLSGFIKSSESVHDIYEAGHSSTSISASLGYLKGNEINNKNDKIIPIIGDGAMTAGVAFEALSYINEIQGNLLVILNDNGMSISKNVGFISKYLSKLRTTDKYNLYKIKTIKFLRKIPILGTIIEHIIRYIKFIIKRIFIKENMFETMGIKYFGGIDGHNIKTLVEVLTHLKNVHSPVILHVKTKKGKGYDFSEKEPNIYHGVGTFNLNEKIQISESEKYQDLVSDSLIKLIEEDKKIVAISAAMPSGTGLTKLKDKYKDNYMDVGIAEQNAVLIAAGLSKNNIKPYVCIYSTFLQRAYDMIIHDVCLQNLSVVFLIDRAGLVGADGETHQGIYDISYLSHIPNVTILAPKDKSEFLQMVDYSYYHKGPLFIRYPKGNYSEINNKSILNDNNKICYEVLTNNKFINEECETSDVNDKKIYIVSYNNMVKLSLLISEKLVKEGYDVEVINPRILIPLDERLKEKLNKKRVVVIEEHSMIGGYGAYLKLMLDADILIQSLPNEYIEHGDIPSLLNKYGLNIDNISKNIKGKWNEKN